MANAYLDQNSRPTLTALSSANDGTIVQVWADPVTHRLLVDSASGTGTVTSVSVVSANGFAGTVATATSTPAITLSTTINSPVLAGNGTAISAATTTGSGSTVVLNGSPTLITPSIAAITVSGGIMTLPTGSSDTLVGRATTDTLTNKNLTSGTNTFPTFNQNTTGSAATLTTTRTIWGQNFNGSANVTGDITLGASSITMTGSIATTGSRVTKVWATDIESTNIPTVGGVALPTASSTTTFTNKRNTRRLTTTNAPGATPTTNTDNVDIMNFTGLNTAITSMTTNLSGTPVDGDLIEFRFTDNGTARAITWGASFSATTVALPTTTVISTMLRVGFEWNGSTWACIATA